MYLKFCEDLKLVKLRFGVNSWIFIYLWFFYLSLPAFNSVPFSSNRH